MVVRQFGRKRLEFLIKYCFALEMQIIQRHIVEAMSDKHTNESKEVTNFNDGVGFTAGPLKGWLADWWSTT